VGVPDAQRAGRAPRLTGVRASASDMFTAMYWPLVGGLVAFILIALFMGWVMDSSRHGGDVDRDGHH
jgi:hypothetical protein